MRLLGYTYILTLSIQTVLANQLECLARINNMTVDGKTDNQGRALPPTATNVTAITYDLCVAECGTSPTPFQWSMFSQQSSSWLLPWLALISTIPFGANDNLENLESMVLTVGSPTLAAFSLALTVLNTRYVKRLFSEYRYPNARKAARILDCLQQSPLQINTHDPTWLASLILLPQNDTWWSELLLWLDYTHTWSIAAVASITWVVISYVFTIVDYFSPGGPTSGNANGQGVGSIGSLWLWLLGIVVGWLQASPECDRKRLCQAMERANERVYVATSDPAASPCNAQDVSDERAIFLRFSLDDDEGARRDEACTPPIFNYTRVFTWAHNVSVVSDAFRNASERATRHEPVIPFPVPKGNAAEGEQESLLSVSPIYSTLERSREAAATATASQVVEYCLPRPANMRRHQTISGNRRGVDSSVASRILVASCFALALQWGTTGGAVLITWFTPTIGLGCRSASFITYAVLSTVVWLMLLVSSMLTFYCSNTIAVTNNPPITNRRSLSVDTGKESTSPSSSIDIRNRSRILHTRTRTMRIASRLSIFLRRTAKLLATLNALWIVTLCLLQFGSFYDRCYCNSNVFGAWPYSKKDAPLPFDVIVPTHEEVVNMRNAWIGGFSLASVSTAVFSVFVGLTVS